MIPTLKSIAISTLTTIIFFCSVDMGRGTQFLNAVAILGLAALTTLALEDIRLAIKKRRQKID